MRKLYFKLLIAVTEMFHQMHCFFVNIANKFYMFILVVMAIIAMKVAEDEKEEEEENDEFIELNPKDWCVFELTPEPLAIEVK